MRHVATALATAMWILVLGAAAPAASSFIQDGAGMFSPATVSDLNARISSFNAQTGKEIVVVTVPALPAGQTSDQAARQAFATQNVDGVLIYIAKDNRQDTIVPDVRGQQAGWFPASTLDTIRASMEGQFKAENYDAGITSAVGGVLDIYRSHVNSLPRSGAANVPANGTAAYRSNPGIGGFHFPMIVWIIIAVVGFMFIRSLMRSFSGGPMAGRMAPPPGPGYPPPGYSPGPGYYGGGGGGFWSGLLGGLGGAFLGNELFRGGSGMLGGGTPGDGQQSADPGWGSDPGQAGMGSSGDWGGGGWGDSGGGGFGGGDSSGGW